MRINPLARWRERARVRVDITQFPLTCILSPEGRGDNVDYLLSDSST